MVWKYILCYIVLLMFGMVWIGSILLVGQWTIEILDNPNQRAAVVIGYVAASIFAAIGSANIAPKLGAKSDKG